MPPVSQDWRRLLIKTALFADGITFVCMPLFYDAERVIAAIAKFLVHLLREGEGRGEMEGVMSKSKKVKLYRPSATYMSQTRDQQRFLVSEVAADWHEPMVP